MNKEIPLDRREKEINDQPRYLKALQDLLDYEDD